VCKELAFRGLILNGLRRRFRTWTAILLSSFLFAVYHMNVFAVGPLFLLGVVLGLLATASGSLWPGVVLHTVCNLLLQSGPLLLGGGASDWSWLESKIWVLAAWAVPCAGMAAIVLWRMWPQRKMPRA
jgi:membrane protease YdiL (CAAX protease family)